MAYLVYFVFIFIILCLVSGIVYLWLYPGCPKCEKQDCPECKIKECPPLSIPTGAEDKLFTQSFNANSVKISWPEHTYFPYGYEANIKSLPCEIKTETKTEAKQQIPAYIVRQQKATAGRPGPKSVVVAK